MITFWKSAEIRPGQSLATAMEFIDLHRLEEELKALTGVEPRLREDGDTMYLEVDAGLDHEGFLDEEEYGDVLHAVELMTRFPKGVYADVDTEAEYETASLFRADPFDLVKPLNLDYRRGGEARC